MNIDDMSLEVQHDDDAPTTGADRGDSFTPSGSTPPAPAPVVPDPAVTALADELTKPAATAPVEQKPAATTPTEQKPAAETTPPTDAATPPTDDTAAPPTTEDQPRDEKGQFIPKQRFNEAVNKEREARKAAEDRARLAEEQLRKREQASTENTELAKIEAQLQAKTEEFSKSVIDGDSKETVRIMSEIRALERQSVTIQNRQESSRVTAQALEAERFNTAVAQIEAEHPVLNPESETYDEGLVDIILATQQADMQRNGTPASVALRAATRTVMERIAKPATATEPVKTTGLSAAAPAPTVDAAAATRRAAQVKANIEAEKTAAPALVDTGADTDAHGAGGRSIPDVTKLSDEEFEALPAATRARMRGDFLS